jgi:type II secretory pathway component PulK
MGKGGSILMITLWILTILVIFSLGLGHRAVINLKLTQYQKDRLSLSYLAKAGVNRSISEAVNDKTQNYDDLKDSWADNQDVFKDMSFQKNSSESVTIGYLTQDRKTGKDTVVYGLIDEERKININRIDAIGQRQLFEILKNTKLDTAKAEELKNIIVEWIDDKRTEAERSFKNS